VIYLNDNGSQIRMQDLSAGDCVRLVDFGKSPIPYRRSLLALGMTVGVEINIVRVAPLGCPVQIDLRGTMLALRKQEANDLVWERVE
jgi:ferrous iron transport protein A